MVQIPVSPPLRLPPVSGSTDYRYDAFISYRHVEPDRKWAKWLHKALETFKTPRPLVAKCIEPRIKRVFRDEEELPASADLSKEIDAALEQSRFLIVVCSPRTPSSQWVNQEVVRFREMGRHDKILALLIEGEPSESFPRALCEIRTEITDEHGEVQEHIEDVEPLAADVRASRDESEGFLKRMALLRFSAAILGCRFDDLRRREAERRKRRLVVGASALLAVAVALAGLSIFAFNQQARAEGEWRRAESERDAKSAALERVLRLADSKRARDLLKEADGLWPIHPNKAPDMGDWIERAQALLENREGHEASLAALRERALPYTAARRLSDHAADRARTKDLRGTLAKALEALDGISKESKPETEEKRETVTKRIHYVRTEIGRLEEKLKERASWQFASGEDAWRHQVLQDLLRDLDRIRDPKEASKGVLADVTERYVAATTLTKRSIGDHREVWDATIAAIAASPKYGGLTIRPQVGLVPLGPDRDSELFEFAHLGSGSLPTRDEATGRLVQADDAAIVLVLIPGGTFLMGAQSKDESKPNFDPWAQDNESGDDWQAVSVTLPPYFLSKYECTQAQWATMTSGMDPSEFEAGTTTMERKHTPRNPVEMVSWEDGVRDPGWLARNRLELPSEAQWEYACRAGTNTPWFPGREIEGLSKVANINTPGVDDGHGVHAPVGSFDANGFGLHDVHGNVEEWCKDLWAGYDSDPATIPVGYDDRARRGGSWFYPARNARSSTRFGGPPTHRDPALGFRPARSVSP